jgi:Molybdopterin-binding domain of aldehyde dehydrogenase
MISVRVGASVFFRVALRQAGLAQALDDPLILRVEGRIVGPVHAGPGLHGEAGIDFLQLSGGLFRFLVVAGPSIGGGEVDEREEALVGKRVAAVVAETESIAEAACRLIDVTYEPLPPVFDPVEAMKPGAPLLHDKGLGGTGNVYVDIHGEVGSAADGFAAADVVHEATYSTSRVQHVHLETHGSIAWQDAEGRLHVRTSSQAPFIVQGKLAHLFGLPNRNIHVFTERVGGGFGGKQEMVTEDLCVLAIADRTLGTAPRATTCFSWYFAATPSWRTWDGQPFVRARLGQHRLPLRRIVLHPVDDLPRHPARPWRSRPGLLERVSAALGRGSW